MPFQTKPCQPRFSILSSTCLPLPRPSLTSAPHPLYDHGQQDTLQEITKKKAKTEAGTEGEASALMLAEFVEKARAGTYISTNDINKVARLFKVRPSLLLNGRQAALLPYGRQGRVWMVLDLKMPRLISSPVLLPPFLCATAG